MSGYPDKYVTVYIDVIVGGAVVDTLEATHELNKPWSLTFSGHVRYTVPNDGEGVFLSLRTDGEGGKYRVTKSLLSVVKPRHYE